MNNIAVVILNYNGEKLLQQFLPSVIQHSPGASIIVADNASTDLSVEILKKEFPDIRLILLEKNYGFCGGYNRALKQVEAEYYVLLNSDVEVTNNWLQPMLELANADASVAAVQPKILSYHQRDHFEYAGAGGGFIDALGYPFCRGRLFDTTEKDSGQYNDTREVFWATGACMFVRSSVYHQLNGLDEDFFAHMEEIDLCWRMQRNGHKVMYTGQSHVFHVGGGTLSHANPRKTYFNFRNGFNLLIKNYSTSELIFKLPVRDILDYVAVLKFMVAGNFRHGWSVLKAHFDIIRNLGTTFKKRRALAEKYLFSTKNTYKGVIAFEYFILRRKRITID